jgi:hypothetical protein
MMSISGLPCTIGLHSRDARPRKLVPFRAVGKA